MFMFDDAHRVLDALGLFLVATITAMITITITTTNTNTPPAAATPIIVRLGSLSSV